MGISGKLGRWLHSFLTERKQFVIANGIKSQESEVLSGVPQGTVLGPTLFLILINDINYNVDSEVSLFADDTRVLKGVQSTEDTDELQKDLEKLYCWQQENNMLFNGKKFEMLRYGKDSDLKESTQYLTPEGESTIEVKSNLRDLGIQMSDDAKFTVHINNVCLKVQQKCGWILRTFKSRDTYFMKTIGKALSKDT